MNNITKNKVAIYVRVSTHHQIDKDSLPLQRQDLINYCKYVLNTENYVIFEDAGYSAKNTDRPQYQQMMEGIKNNEFSHLLVWKIDRISRNLLDFCDMYEDLKRYGCTFVSKNEQFDTSSAMGEAMLKIVLVFAELERKLTGERVKAVMLDRASRGLWNGAPIPLGYCWDEATKFPTPDETERTVVEFIFNQYSNLQSTSSVRNVLNTNGIKTKKDGTWTTKTISDIIRNPFYIGTYRYNYKEPSRGKKKAEKEWIMLEDNHTAIITKELWNKCNNIMDINAERNNARFRSNTKIHIFAGLLECGECHNSLYSKQDKPHLDGYVPSLYCCTGRYNKLGCEQRTISEKIIGEFVLTYISILLKTSKNPRKIAYKAFEDKLLTEFKVLAIDGLEDVFATITSPNSSKAKFNINKSEPSNNNNIENDILKKEKIKYERALNRLEDLYLFDDESMSEKDYLIKKNRLNDKLQEINNKLKSTANTDSFDNDFMNMMATFILTDVLLESERIDVKELINRVDREILKEFVNAIIDKVVVKDKKVISIKFKNGLISKFIYS